MKCSVIWISFLFLQSFTSIKSGDEWFWKNIRDGKPGYSEYMKKKFKPGCVFFIHLVRPQVNEDGIYNSELTYRYTMKSSPDRVFAIVLKYPESNQINLYSIKEFVNDKTKVTMLGFKGEMKMTTSADHVTVEFPYPFASYKISQLAWTFAFASK